MPLGLAKAVIECLECQAECPGSRPPSERCPRTPLALDPPSMDTILVDLNGPFGCSTSRFSKFKKIFLGGEEHIRARSPPDHFPRIQPFLDAVSCLWVEVINKDFIHVLMCCGVLPCRSVI